MVSEVFILKQGREEDCQVVAGTNLGILGKAVAGEVTL
jgi:hypothetical protein